MSVADEDNERVVLDTYACDGTERRYVARVDASGELRVTLTEETPRGRLPDIAVES